MRFYEYIYKNSGQAALSTMILIGGIISLIAVTLVIIISSYTTSAYAFYNTQRALAVANAGIDDALLKIIRNKSFENPTGYLVYIGSDSATVTVTRNSPDQTTIISTSNIFGYRKKIKAVVSIDDDGEVRMIKKEYTE